ncbi:hypothetical protein [Pontimonas sp.]
MSAFITHSSLVDTNRRVYQLLRAARALNRP